MAISLKTAPSAATADKSDRLADQLQSTETRLGKLEEVLEGIQALMREQQKEIRDRPVAAAPRAAQPQVPVTPVRPAPAADDSFDDYCKADDKALEHYNKNEFGKAFQVFDNFLLRHPTSIYKARIESRKQKFEDHAHELYGAKIVPQAKLYASQKNLELAKKLYQTVLKFGMPELMRKAQGEIDAISAQMAKRSEDSVRLSDATNATREPGPSVTVEPPRTADTVETKPVPVPPARRIPDATGPTRPQVDRSTAALIDVIEDAGSEEYKRKTAIRDLSGSTNPKAIAALVGATRDNEWSVQLEAALALGECADARAVYPLIELLDHKMIAVSQAANSALKKLTEGGPTDTSKEAWTRWWDQNRARFGVPARAAVPKRTQAPPEVGITTPAKSKGEGFILHVYPAKDNLVLFSAAEMKPQPKVGELLNVVRDNQLVARVEVVHVGAGLGKAIIAVPKAGKSIKVNDSVTR